MKKWTDSNACYGRTHCVACRVDITWRESVRRNGLVESANFDCPHGITTETAPAVQAEAMAKLPGYDPEAAAKAKAQLEEKGRAAWLWLHEESRKDALTKERLKKEFEPMIPAYSCGCRREWLEILQRNPLPVSGQAEWAVRCHDAVNAKLGKPLFANSLANNLPLG